MVRFGIIGTNFITDRFIAGGKLCEGFAVRAVYSRTMEKAREFAAKYGVEQVYDRLEDLAESGEIDAVYIASPNYCHAGQAAQMLRAGKHVLVEKPATANAREWEELCRIARENNVILLEAMRSVFLPEYKAIRENLHKLGTIRRATLSYCQYSSRYDKFKNGIIENAFRPELCNGSMMDIGVYCINALIDLFGAPQAVDGNCLKMHNGVDGAGTITANYGDMQAEVLYSKITNSFNASEIQGEKGCMLIQELPNPTHIEIVYNTREREDLGISASEQNMQFEVREFIRLVEEKDHEAEAAYAARTLAALELMDAARAKMEIVFPNDQK